MNNADNTSRVVINLDGAFDDLDDDDITLPSMPVQSVPIIDEGDVQLDDHANQDALNQQQIQVNNDLSAPKISEDIALGTPIVSPELTITTKTAAPNTASDTSLNISSTTLSTDVQPKPATDQSAIPKMPLQAQLGDGAASNLTNIHATNTNNASATTNDVQQQEVVLQSSETPSKEIDSAQKLQESDGESQEVEPQDKQKGSWFNRMKSGLSKSRKNLAEGMVSILIGGKEIDDELLEEVEDQLLVADIGVNATNRIIKSLTEQTARGDLIYAHSLYKALQTELVEILTPKVAPLVIDTTKKPFVILVVGVNGVGKTTTIGKLAKRLQGEGKSVMLAAGDTFRAAATEQLQIWGERNDIPVVAQGHGSDSASVIFDAMQSAKAKNIDVLIADTAGRLQNKTHLMAELEKVVRVMRKADPSAPHEGMIVLDAGTGQNAINQVELFNNVVPLTGITITKLDGTAKGGVVFNIAETTDVPIRYIGVGESIDDLRAFSPKQFVAALFETDDKE